MRLSVTIWYVRVNRLVVKGEMRAAPADLSSLLVTNLETPLGSVPRAKLRGTDVLAVEL